MAIDWTAIPQAFTVIEEAVKPYLTALVPLSKQLLGVAVLISGGWLLLKESIANSPRNAIAALMLLIMQASIALSVIVAWPWFAQIIHDLQTDLSMALGGGGNAIVAALTPIAKQFEPLWQFFANQQIPPATEDMGPLDTMVYYMEESIAAIFVLPVTMLMSLLTALILGLIVAVLGGAIMFAELSIVIGLVAAPFMIAMNFFPYVSFTIDGMVRFLLGAIILKLVAMLAALILGAALDSVFALNLSATGTMAARLVAMTYVLVIASMFLYAAIKVDDIARALVSGGVVGGPMARVISGGATTAASAGAAGAVGGLAAGGRAAPGAAAAVGKGFGSGGVSGAARGLASGVANVAGSAADGAASRSGWVGYKGSISEKPRR